MLTDKQFKARLAFVSHAMAKQDVRYFLNGVLLDVINPQQIRLVATDGHRLACVTLDSSSDDHGIPEGQYIFTTDLVANLLKSIKLKKRDPDYPVAIDIEDYDVTVSWQDQKIFGKLIDGKFPDYARVIPDLDEPVTTAEGDPIDWSDPKIRKIGVNCTYFEQAFRACRFIANEVYEGIILHMRGSNSSLVITIPDNSELTITNALIVIMPMKL